MNYDLDCDLNLIMSFYSNNGQHVTANVPGRFNEAWQYEEAQ